MNTKHLKSLALGAALVMAGVVAGGEAAFAYQGHMFAARGDLQAARNQLSMALTDKDGHRVNALNLVDQAIQQTNQGIAAGAR